MQLEASQRVELEIELNRPPFPPFLLASQPARPSFLRRNHDFTFSPLPPADYFLQAKQFHLLSSFPFLHLTLSPSTCPALSTSTPFSKSSRGS